MFFAFHVTHQYPRLAPPSAFWLVAWPLLLGLSAALIATASPASSPTCATATRLFGCIYPLVRLKPLGSSYFRLSGSRTSPATLAPLAGYPGYPQQASRVANLGGRFLCRRWSASGSTWRRSHRHIPALRITDVANFPASSCGQAEAAGLRVHLPNRKASRWCRSHSLRAKAGEAFLQVTAVQI